MKIRDAACCADERVVRAAAAEGCEESRLALSRRAVLGVSAGLFSWACTPGWAKASAEATSDPRFLVVVLRGGMDGLSTVVPHGDKAYRSLRGDLAIPSNKTIKLDNFFGLHPSLKNFGKLYKKGDASVVHATCVPLRNRSHFDTQDNLENGHPGATTGYATGWLNRLLSALPSGSPIVTHGGIQIGEAPLILRGPAPVLGWSPERYSHLENPLLYMVRTLYKANDTQMYNFLEAGLKADKLAEGKGSKDKNISDLRKGFRGAARLLRASNGPRIAALSVDGWDTHTDQGVIGGQFANLLTELDQGIEDFRKATGPTWKKTVMVLVTEFGRTARTNGDDGTDHGVGTVALLAGGAVKGGKVVSDWPGLAPSQLYDGSDLKATTDLRSVFKGVLADHLGVPGSILDTSVFPESGGVKQLNGLISASSGDGLQIAESSGRPVSLTSMAPIARYRRGEPVSGAGPRVL
jgi:uncharacterized protein (DUF1501 family)